MSLVRSLPSRAISILSNNIFSAPFTGVYDFSIASNQIQQVIKLETNSVYFISALSVGGNVASEDYLSSITNPLSLTLTRKLDRAIVVPNPFILSHFFQGVDVSIFVMSPKQDDYLMASVNGSLDQIESTLGVSPLKINVSFSIFQMNDRDYQRAFVSPLGQGGI